jgi:polysaccharide export outer membrane protein
MHRGHTAIAFLVAGIALGCASHQPVPVDAPPVLPPSQVTAAAPEAARLMSTEEQLAALQTVIAQTTALPGIGKSDVLNISVYDEPDLSVSGIPVRPDGKISFPLVGDVQAEGLTGDELAASLTERLRQYLLAPKVSVIVQEFNSLNYTIYGEVVRPGVYPLHTDVTITDAIAKAGGLNKGQFRATSVELADLTHAFISRQGKIMPVDFVRLLRDGDMRFNINLQPGDLISIPSGLSQEVYVIGEVNKTALFAYREDMPMSRTLAQAEGFTKDADLSRIHVIRGALSNPVLIVSDFNKVINGEAQDVRLEPGDIIYVPPKHLATWARMVNQIMPTITAIQTGIILSNTSGGGN